MSPTIVGVNISDTYKMGQNRTVKMRDLTEPFKHVHPSLSQGFRSMRTNTFSFKRCSPGQCHPSSNRDTWQACKSNTAPNRPHKKMYTAEPGASIGGVEQEGSKAEL